MISRRALTLLALAGLAGAAACTAYAQAPARTPGVLRLATTTSTADTGLLNALLPSFEQQCGCRVEVVAVGTGQAIELGRRGDADVLLVHALSQELAFIAEGHATRRDDVMYNDFVVVGPATDPAHVAGATAVKDVFRRLAAGAAPFASRGDRSGTHTKELAIWASIGVMPATASAWYLSVGQGMGETLAFANERQAYVLSDRGTWLSMQTRLPGLRLLFGGTSIAQNPEADLRNQYGVIVVDAARHPGVNSAVAARFGAWLLSVPVQERIGAFGRDRVGQPLFYPNSAAYLAATRNRGGRT